jgi:hypothetical protein
VFAFEEMLKSLKDLANKSEIPDKFIEMLRRAQNQREMTLKQVTRGLAEIERLSKKMEKMVEVEMERRTNMYQSVQAWIDAVDQTQHKYSGETQQQQESSDES